MYEKLGLMSVIRHPQVIEYLQNEQGITKKIEGALRKKIGINEATKEKKKKLAVKIFDPVLIDYVISQRKKYGVTHRFTIENAILELINDGGKNHERNSGKCD